MAFPRFGRRPSASLRQKSGGWWARSSGLARACAEEVSENVSENTSWSDHEDRRDEVRSRPGVGAGPRVESVRRAAGGISRLLRGGAWLFAIVSLAALGGVLIAGVADPGRTTSLYQSFVQTSSGVWILNAWGLTYSGVLGLGLAAIQVGLVGGALWLSLRPALTARMVGHFLLLGWAALWMGNLAYLAGLGGTVEATGQALAMAAFFLCTLFRASHGMMWGGALSANTSDRIESSALTGLTGLTGELPGELADELQADELQDLTPELVSDAEPKDGFRSRAVRAAKLARERAGESLRGAAQHANVAVQVSRRKIRRSVAHGAQRALKRVAELETDRPQA